MIDMIVAHFESMGPEDDQKVLSIAIHHNQIHHFMRIFNRQEYVADKPVYCWTAYAELEYDPQTM